MYNISFECNQAYIGSSSHSIEIRIKEHHHHICLAQPENFAVADHSVNQDRIIKYQETKILATKTGYAGHLVRVTIKLERHHKNMNREEGLILRRSWKSLIWVL